ncbi:MAG: DegT/DnrJ/EryC1/StrS family aminotransferase [Gammaproteobacteria bacterium]|nr:DegT/DnrJ/EryC1/StrS family aminotransferase [Gammaproteobacteria bacterium]
MVSHKVAVTKVPFIDLSRQYLLHREEILKKLDEILSSGNYILGNAVEEFEKKIAEYLHCPFVLGVANGTDAIILVLKSFQIGAGDEVIVPVNSFLATAGAVAAVGATPVFCDVKADLNIDVEKLPALINKKTKAIIPVHLTGKPAEMDKVMEIAKHFSLYVIEDAAQSIGARYKTKMSGTIGHAGCFSLHPLKNLHIYGDGGLITTHDEKLYQDLKLLRNHGLVNRDTCLKWGLNSRLDSLQAGIGTIGLAYLDQWNNRRREIAAIYQETLKPYLSVPIDKSHEHSVYHNFVVQTEHRDQLQQFLAQRMIETKIHYPIQIHLQPAAKNLNYKLGDFPEAERLAAHMLSLPVYSDLTDQELGYVIGAIRDFFG